MRRQVAAVAAAAVAAGGFLTACSGDDGGAAASPSGAGSSRSSIDLPDKLGTMVTYAAACGSGAVKRADLCLKIAHEADGVTQAAAENLSAAYDGAAAAGERYASDDLDRIVRVFAVGAPSPGLWTLDSDANAAYQALGHPEEWVEELDGAQCLVRTESPVPEGAQWSPDNVFVLRCQATGDDLTVIVYPGLDVSLDEAFSWTRQLFDETE